MTWYATPNRERFTGGTGWLASAYAGGGILGSAVPSTGSNGHASPIYNDLVLPADANKEFAWAIVTAPSGGGTFVPYEDGSFYYLGPSTSFTYQLYQDFIAVGTPATVTITVATSFTGAAALDDLTASGSFVVAGAAVSFTGTAALEDVGAAGSFVAVGASFTGASALEDLGAAGSFVATSGASSFTGAAALDSIGAAGSFVVFSTVTYIPAPRQFISPERGQAFTSPSRAQSFTSPARNGA